MNKPIPSNEIQDALKPLFEFAQQVDAARKREAARRAQLTQEQRDAEDQAQARAIQAEKARKIEVKIQNAATPYRGRDSLPIQVFAAVLHGLDADSLGWGFFSSRELDTTIELLESCVEVSLYPVDETESRSKRRFATRDLIAVACVKRYANVDVVARALGFEPPVQPTTATSQTAAPAPADDGKATKDTHKQLVQAAIDLLIRETRAVAKDLEINRDALPFMHMDILERYNGFCAERGLVPLGARRVRQLVVKAGYHPKPGHRAGPQRDAVSKLRSPKKSL